MLKRCVLQICEALSIKRNPSPLLLCNFVNLSIVVIYLDIRASEHLIWAFDIRANRLKIKLKYYLNSSLVYVTLRLLLNSLKRVCVFINSTKHGRRSLSIKKMLTSILKPLFTSSLSFVLEISRFLCFCETIDFKICDLIIDIAT